MVGRRPLAGELEELLAVHLSNPGYLALTEGSAGEAGRYDLQMLERDLAVAALTPGRHVEALFERETGEVVGVLDWLEENPSDGLPWIGLVMIRADRQRRGLASEALAALAARLRGRGAAGLRGGVVERNGAGLALARKLGFEPVSDTVVRMASEERVVVFELGLMREFRTKPLGFEPR